MRYLTLLLCAVLFVSCANKQQERAVIAGAILGGMIGAVTSQPSSTHATEKHGHSGSSMHNAGEQVSQEDMQDDEEHDKHKYTRKYKKHDDEHEKDD